MKSTGIIDNFQNQKENTLHVAIALESIKKDEIVKQEVATNGVARQYSPSFTISIADYFRKINPSDESFYKYIPKKFLKDNNSGSIKYSLKDGKAVDNGGAVRYNRKKIAHYISYAKLGSETVQYIRSELKKIYGNDDGVADGIAIAKGEKIYVIDSGRENGKINFGVRNIRTIRDVSFRQEIVRRINSDALSKGHISDGLSSRFGDRYDNDTGRSLRRESGAELSADKRKSADHEGRISGEDEHFGGVKYSLKSDAEQSRNFNDRDGQELKAEAQVNREKVYTRTEARQIINSILSKVMNFEFSA